MTTHYTTGTISLTNGSAVIAGIGTAWQTALIAGGIVMAEADGNPLPILSVDSNVQITAAIKWKGASGTYAYAIMRDMAYGQQTVANAQALSTYLQRLDNASLAALASLGSTLGAGKVPRGLNANTMEWFTVSDFVKTLLDDVNVGSALATLNAVQQGGGVGQSTHKTYLGWSVTGLRAQVEATDLGFVWTDYGVSKNLAATGYEKLPSGVLRQWGVIAAGGDSDLIVGFPVTFPTAVAGIRVQPAPDPAVLGYDKVFSTSIDVGYGTSTFIARRRMVSPGGTISNQSYRTFWEAFGY